MSARSTWEEDEIRQRDSECGPTDELTLHSTADRRWLLAALDALRAALRSALTTDAERDRGGHATADLTDDEILDRVRRGVEIEDTVIAYLDSIDGPLGDPAEGLACLRRAVGR